MPGSRFLSTPLADNLIFSLLHSVRHLIKDSEQDSPAFTELLVQSVQLRRQMVTFQLAQIL